MFCPRCEQQMTVEFLDDELKRSEMKLLRVKKECPKCFLRLFCNLREGKKV